MVSPQDLWSKPLVAWIFFQGWQSKYPVLFRDYFINQYKDSVLNQPVWLMVHVTTVGFEYWKHIGGDVTITNYFPSIWETRHPPKRRRDGFGRYKSTARVFGFCFGFSPLSWKLKVVMKKVDWWMGVFFSRKKHQMTLLTFFSRFCLFLLWLILLMRFFFAKSLLKKSEIYLLLKDMSFWFLKCHIKRWLSKSFFPQVKNDDIFMISAVARHWVFSLSWGHWSSWSVEQLVICNIYGGWQNTQL